MNYLKVYCKLVRKAENRTLTSCYIEKHHVFPVSIYGQNNRTVVFTYREHFIAHRLLAKIFKKRYGLYDSRTRKMNMAVHRMVYTHENIGYIHNSHDYEIARKAVRDAKVRKPRLDLIGKSYFGASEERIKAGIEKMRAKKTGIKYPYKKRGPRPHSELQDKHISEGRQKTQEKYKNMTDKEFWEWVSKQKRYTNSKFGIFPNGNILRAMETRGIPFNKFYDITDFSSSWLKKEQNLARFYGFVR